jgi:hypothetical protein
MHNQTATAPRWSIFHPSDFSPGSVRRDVVEEGLYVKKAVSLHTDPARAIVHYLKEHPTNLIVLATHQREGPARWVQRAVAEPVAHQAKTMTLSVPLTAYRDTDRHGSSFKDLVITSEAQARRPRERKCVPGSLRKRMLEMSLSKANAAMRFRRTASRKEKPSASRPAVSILAPTRSRPHDPGRGHGPPASGLWSHGEIRTRRWRPVHCREAVGGQSQTAPRHRRRSSARGLYSPCDSP